MEKKLQVLLDNAKRVPKLGSPRTCAVNEPMAIKALVEFTKDASSLFTMWVVSSYDRIPGDNPIAEVKEWMDAEGNYYTTEDLFDRFKVHYETI